MLFNDMYEYELNKLNDKEKEELYKQLHDKNKHLGINNTNKHDKNFFNSIVNLLLEGTTIIAYTLGIIDNK